MDKKVGKQLILWYERVKRDLPWRETRDPYFIWVSEIILQQTRVQQGLPYYLKFIKRFSDIQSLANATEEEVLKYWQGLGYYSRARNMHAAAKQICEQHQGVFPSEYDQVLKLKGIGPYTAAAISSIAFNKPYVVIDGNVSRAVSRLFGIEEAVNTAIGVKKIEEKLKIFFIENKPGDFNQAMMELGSQVCKPISPDCDLCPLSKNCMAFNYGSTAEFPVKLKQKSPKQVYLYYFVLKQQKESSLFIYINKRKENAIWKNLYDFPGIESENKRKINEVITEFKQKFKIFNIDNNLLKITGPVKHQLTHKNISAFFIEININAHFSASNHPKIIPVALNNLQNYPVPKLIENYIKKYIFND